MPADAPAKVSIRGRRLRVLVALVLGCVCAALLVVTSERICLVLNNRVSAGVQTVTGGTSSEGFFVRDSALGYRARANATVTANKLIGDTMLYDVSYRTNELGFRVTPPSPVTIAPTRTIAFFGCSYTFGEGVEDDQTIPARVAAAMPDAKVVNLGFPGYGPQNLLVALDDSAIVDAIRGPGATAVYLFIDPHVDRAIGAMYFATRWGRGMAHYKIEGDELIRRGDFLSGRPWVAGVYDVVSRSEMAAYFKVQLPPRRTPAHLDLTARIIAEASRSYREKSGGGRFYVAMFPGVRLGDEIASRLRDAPLTILDYSRRVDLDAPGMTFPGDGHPTAAAYTAVAELIAGDLIPER